MFEVYDDSLPELEERFAVRLTGALASDGLVGSTPTSGASLLPEDSSRDISIDLNDHPYGLLQFSTDGEEPRPWDPLLPPATEQPRVRAQLLGFEIKLVTSIIISRSYVYLSGNGKYYFCITHCVGLLILKPLDAHSVNLTYGSYTSGVTCNYNIVTSYGDAAGVSDGGDRTGDTDGGPSRRSAGGGQRRVQNCGRYGQEFGKDTS